MMRDDILGGVFERDFVFGPAERLYIFEGMDIKTSESIPPATPAAGFRGGGCNPRRRSTSAKTSANRTKVSPDTGGVPLGETRVN